MISPDFAEPRSAELSELERLRRENAALRAQLEDASARREELLHKSAALKTVLASIPYSVFWKDRNSNFLGCNHSLAELAGLTHPDEIVGKTDYDMPWTREAESYRAFDRRVIDEGYSITNLEEQFVDVDGKLKVVLTSKVPLRADDGSVLGVVGIFTDITPRKQMELDLQAAKESAEAADRAKGDFLATISHELRTPLALILGPLEDMVRRDDLPERERRDAGRVLRNAWRLKNLVDDILEFSKGEARMKMACMEPVDTAQLTRVLVEEAQTAASHRGLHLEFVAEDLPTQLLDAHMYERIVLNLLANALKFTPTGGRITVTLRRCGEAFELEVRDTGIGIAPEDQLRLFQRFQQIDASSTRRYEGTGLGLALVKQFAELLNGEVAVASKPDEGSRFTVTLPRRDLDSAPTPRAQLLTSAPASRAARIAAIAEPGASHDATGPSSDAASPPALGEGAHRATVALAEDNSDLRDYAAEVLGARYHVIAYRDGVEALRGIEAHPPDVVVSDVMMPGLDGYQLVTALKSHPELVHIPILLLTARAGRDVVVASLERGADDFLNKPFAAAELVARVGAAVRLSRLYQELRRKNCELLQTRDMLIEAEKLSALGRLLTQLSHEINNPMTIIVGNLASAVTHFTALAEMLREYRAAATALPAEAEAALQRRSAELDIPFITEDFPALLEAVQEAADRVQHIQQDLRSFLRGDPLETVVGDLNAGLRTTVDMLRRGLPPDIQITARYGELPPARHNTGQIKQVILNVLQNAVDAVRTQGRIEVESSTDERAVTIAISNSGPPIPSEHRRKIFDPFFTTKETSKGSGIGLAVCRQILTRHGGRIWLDESFDAGARFVIELPHVNAEPRGST